MTGEDTAFVHDCNDHAKHPPSSSDVVLDWAHHGATLCLVPPPTPYLPRPTKPKRRTLALRIRCAPHIKQSFEEHARASGKTFAQYLLSLLPTPPSQVSP